VQQMAISKQGDKLAFVTNEGGISKLYLLDTKTKKYKQVSDIPTGQVYGLLFATPLTLALLPCLYLIQNDMGKILKWIVKIFKKNQ
jgi:hypothetical protein